MKRFWIAMFSVFVLSQVALASEESVASSSGQAPAPVVLHATIENGGIQELQVQLVRVSPSSDGENSQIIFITYHRGKSKGGTVYETAYHETWDVVAQRMSAISYIRPLGGLVDFVSVNNNRLVYDSILLPGQGNEAMLASANEVFQNLVQELHIEEIVVRIIRDATPSGAPQGTH